MNKLILCGAALAAVVGGGAVIAQTAPVVGHVGPMNAIKTRADVQSHLGKMFARLDANKDGFLTQAEVAAGKAQRSAKMEQRMQKRAERRDPAKRFDRLDANHDGQLTQAEVQARFEARAAKRAQNGAQHVQRLFGRVDANKDGIITRAEMAALPEGHGMMMRHAGMHGGMAGQMFGRADLNKDGRVSLAEAQQLALQHFDRVDLNHDGQLTPAERQQARQQMRAMHHPG